MMILVTMTMTGVVCDVVIIESQVLREGPTSDLGVVCHGSGGPSGP